MDPQPLLDEMSIDFAGTMQMTLIMPIVTCQHINAAASYGMAKDYSRAQSATL
jgi:hypothetical protein